MKEEQGMGEYGYKELNICKYLLKILFKNVI